MAYVDIFVGNNTHINPEVYQLWLNGYTAQEAAVIEQKRGILQEYGVTFDMLLSDTLDHYRTFVMLERVLKCPTRIIEQLEFQLTASMQTLLIEKYYEFDATVIREILSKTLSSRHRNALDDVSDKTRVPLPSCRRQFDNVKRVFKSVEEMCGSLVDNIKENFKLSDQLAQQYAAIVFIIDNRFETGKKKLGYLTFDDLVHCAGAMITNWSTKGSKDQDMDVDLERDFLQGLREMKTFCDKEFVDEHRVLVVQRIQKKLSPSAICELDSNFKNLSKALVNIAYGLNHSKELKDLFLDLVEKLIEPCRHAGWTPRDLKLFLEAYKDTSYLTEFFTRQSSANLKTVWERYMTTIISCVMKIYHN